MSPAARWPQVLDHKPAGQRDEYAKMMAYFDAVNFSRKIAVPVIIGMGLKDTTCPPGSIYSAYNVMSSPKRPFYDPNVGHEKVKDFRAFHEKWIRAKLDMIGETVAP